MGAGRMNLAWGVVLGAMSALGCFSAWAGASSARDAKLDEMLQKEAQDYVDNFVRAHPEEGGFNITVRSWADLEAGIVYADFGPGALTDEDLSNERLEQELGSTLLHYARNSGMPRETQFRALYQGKPYDHYFPYVPAKWGPGLSRLQRRSGGLAVVSASHGLYFNHGSKAWVFQRDLMNGILEDLVTPPYAEALNGYLASRSSMTVRLARRHDPADHAESHQPWDHMSARYNFKALYPEETDIWHSLPGDSSDDRELKEDIRARPKYANFIQADALFSIHTNGSDRDHVRGLEVYYHEDKPQDRPLADSILCYTEELITGQEGYENFPIRGPAKFGRHGENRIGLMPSVIVEVAYHSNPEDALALQDPVFREASMKGVEKGYRLWREGKGCNPLKVDPIATIRVAAGQSQVVDLAFAGFPQYPVVIETKNVACPPGWKCTDGAVTLPDPDSKPAQITLRCENAGSAPIYWDTRMVDDDGVKSPPVRHIVQCVRGSGVLASPAAHVGDAQAATARRLP
ncbi:N-acetylmuramoyl-L-alanine amidase family protein [Stenotrophomonas chelatiphaga]|uniref:N-acetylmuramoyl-L-alanine amidase family protein n=1 Tax=Stenotrophomonas chelatiphaga TaxID=517011 RepID=UPI0028A20038|nr:N-acetylmuramoyl-L-alanine amidase [Stenotrophomonas chelatiphaga]